MTTLPGVEAIAARIAAHEARAAPSTWAATALVLGEGDRGPQVAFIRRVSRDGDPWSGDMALPGGKVDPGDLTPEAAAIRETAEEVGLGLGTSIGRLDDVEGRSFAKSVACAVFTLPTTPPLVPERGEVAEAVWLPLADLADPGSRTWHRYGGVVPFRSITVGEYMIWGLTHRILTNFFAVAGLS